VAKKHLWSSIVATFCGLLLLQYTCRGLEWKGRPLFRDIILGGCYVDFDQNGGPVQFALQTRTGFDCSQGTPGTKSITHPLRPTMVQNKIVVWCSVCCNLGVQSCIQNKIAVAVTSTSRCGCVPNVHSRQPCIHPADATNCPVRNFDRNTTSHETLDAIVTLSPRHHHRLFLDLRRQQQCAL
jgi:hypothetical protein